MTTTIAYLIAQLTVQSRVQSPPLFLSHLRYSKRDFGQRIMMLLMSAGIFTLSGCTINDPYGAQQRGPVDVRRGEHYGKPVYQQEQQGYGRAAPQVNQPTYPAHRQHEDSSQPQEETGPFENQPLESPVPAVARLVTRAENFIKQEDYASAAASAESALRLDPQSISAYHTLARTYLFEGRLSESEQMALRALSILRSKGASTNHPMSKNLWLLIAETRRSRGDTAGAEKAMQQSGGRF